MKNSFQFPENKGFHKSNTVTGSEVIESANDSPSNYSKLQPNSTQFKRPLTIHNSFIQGSSSKDYFDIGNDFHLNEGRSNKKNNTTLDTSGYKPKAVEDIPKRTQQPLFPPKRRESIDAITIPDEEENNISTTYVNYKINQLPDQLMTTQTTKGNQSFTTSSPNKQDNTFLSKARKTATKSHVSSKIMQDRQDWNDKLIERILHTEEGPTTSEFRTSKESPHHLKPFLSTLRTPNSKGLDRSFSNLKKINLIDRPNFEQETSNGLGVIKTALDQALEEKENLKNIVEGLKAAIKEEKDRSHEHKKHQSLLLNESYKLALKNENIDAQNTTSDVLINAVRNEVLTIKKDIENYQIKLQTLIERITEEKEMIDAYKANSKDLKLNLSKETKERDHWREIISKSRQSLQKAKSNYEKIDNDKQNFVLYVEKNIRSCAGGQ